MSSTLRSLLKTPWLSAVIIGSLAIGVGSNTVIFSWLKGAVFQPLPAVTAEVWSLETKDDTGGYVTTSWLEYRDLITMTPSLEAIAAQRPRAFYLGDNERESRIFGQLVSGNFFAVLGVVPAHGRFFRPDEAEQPGSAPVVVISHDFWQGYFKGVSEVLGQTLKLNGRAFTVVGVTGERFRGGMNSVGFDVWLPLTMAAEVTPSSTELTARNHRPYLMLTRIKSGATLAPAQGDLGGRGCNKDTGRVFLDQLLQRLETTPGVERAAAAALVPLDLRGMPTGVISVTGKPFDPERKILYYGATPGYFATMGMAFVDGRDLSPLSRIDLPLDAVINEEMARRYWPEGSPVGRRFEVNGFTCEIAGVVRNAKCQTLNEPLRPLAWITFRAQFIGTPTLHVRSRSGDPRALQTAVRAAVRGLDPELPLLDPRSLAQHVDTNLFMQKVPAQMLTVLGPLALALPAIGLYAVLAYSLSQRTQEIGVRLTLGATPRSVVTLMIWQHMRIVLVSVVIGWLAALGAGYYLRNSFVGVSAGDPLIYIAAPALLLAVATLACWLPARRAARVDPMTALRTE